MINRRVEWTLAELAWSPNGHMAGHRHLATGLEHSRKIAGPACQIHAFVVHGTVDAHPQSGRIWRVWLVPVTPGGPRGCDPW